MLVFYIFLLAQNITVYSLFICSGVGRVWSLRKDCVGTCLIVANTAFYLLIPTHLPTTSRSTCRTIHRFGRELASADMRCSNVGRFKNLKTRQDVSVLMRCLQPAANTPSHPHTKKLYHTISINKSSGRTPFGVFVTFLFLLG